MAKKKATSKKTTVKVVSKEAKSEATTSKKIVLKKKSNSIIEQISKPKFIASIAAEFVGTFLLAAAVIAGQGQPLVVLFALTAIVLMIGATSGAHVNPLITVGAWATRRINSVKAVGYILAQILGSMLAFVVIKSFIDGAPALSEEAIMYGQQAPSMFTATAIPSGKEWFILFAELLGSAIFAFSVAHTTSNKNNNSTAVALGVGSGLFVAALIANSAATIIGGGAILNPAVAISLQAFSVEGTNTLWAIATYVGAALIGGIAGFAFSSLISKNEK
jgi:aquaporin Z